MTMHSEKSNFLLDREIFMEYTHKAINQQIKNITCLYQIMYMRSNKMGYYDHVLTNY